MGLDALKASDQKGPRGSHLVPEAGWGSCQASGDVREYRGTFRGQLLCLETVIYCGGLWLTPEHMWTVPETQRRHTLHT